MALCLCLHWYKMLRGGAGRNLGLGKGSRFSNERDKLDTAGILNLFFFDVYYLLSSVSEE